MLHVVLQSAETENIYLNYCRVALHKIKTELIIK